MNPRNYILDLEKVFELSRSKREYITDTYYNMLSHHREFLAGDKCEDMFLAFFNTLNSNGYLKHSPQMNEEESKLHKKSENRNSQIDDILKD
jgi:hypothetical protein